MFKFLWSTLWGQILLTFLISMVPVIELRGAIPVATGAGLSPFIAIPVAILGNLLPVPFIILFIKKLTAPCFRDLWVNTPKLFPTVTAV